MATEGGFVRSGTCFENSLQRALSRVGCVSRSLSKEKHFFVFPLFFPFDARNPKKICLFFSGKDKQPQIANQRTKTHHH